MRQDEDPHASDPVNSVGTKQGLLGVTASTSGSASPAVPRILSNAWSRSSLWCFAGVGTHDVAIPINLFKEEGAKFVLAGATKEAIQALPRFEYAK